MAADQKTPHAAGGMIEEPPYPAERYAWYVVGVLMVVYVFSFIDRQILALLVKPIKADLGITDFQMGLLMGPSFAIFYTLFGIPMGRLADTKSRRTIIAFGLALWSLMSAGCGIARSYTTLFLFRIGVGVGEATLSPAAYSMITDYFRPGRMALAQSIYGAGIYIGSGLAMLLGGLVVGYASGKEAVAYPIIGDVRPWQQVFFLIGLPGLLFAPMLLSVREPLRRGMIRANAASAKPVQVPVGEVFAYIWKNIGTFVCHNIGFAMMSFIGYAAAAWIPTFYARVHGWTPAEIGTRYGIVVIIFGTSGIIFGGHFAGMLAKRGYRDSKMRAAFIAALCYLPFGLAFPLMPNVWMAFALMIPAKFFAAMTFGVGPAAIQEMMPNQMRGSASAVYLFVVNLIGIGCGPPAVAACTQYLFEDELRVGHSLVLMGTVACFTSILFLGLGLARFRRSLDTLKEWQAAN